MSTPTAQPAEAKANNTVVGSRHTAAKPVSDDEGWTQVRRGRSRVHRASSDSEQVVKPKPKKKWVETKESRTRRAEAAAIALRRSHMAHSLYYGRSWEAPTNIGRVPAVVDGLEGKYDSSSDTDVVVPSQTRVKHAYKPRPRTALKHRTASMAINVPPPLPVVTKEEAAKPVSPPLVENVSDTCSTVSFSDSPPFSPAPSSTVREVNVVHSDERSQNMVDNSANRTITVRLRSYRLVSAEVLAVARRSMSDRLFGEVAGLVCSKFG